MPMLSQIVDIFLHLDTYLAQLSASYGVLVYLILFLIIFAETGLIVTPFLPGDSLLFAAGALASIESSGLNIWLMWGLLISAAFLGDNTNYHVGRTLGARLFIRENSLFLNPKYLTRTQEFYREHGAKTVLFARFMPILRTFAPFVAGMGKMNYRKFIVFSFVGSVAWMSCFLGAGFYFGNLPSVKNNFHLVIFTVIGVSFLPVLVSALRGFFRDFSR
ncbi:MAG: DedA family protein [Bdellovibrionaceae bacterium]|nr:DedA family protein [Pseudobdellovibrionaceae bacterium]